MRRYGRANHEAVSPISAHLVLTDRLLRMEEGFPVVCLSIRQVESTFSSV